MLLSHPKSIALIIVLMLVSAAVTLYASNGLFDRPLPIPQQNSTANPNPAIDLVILRLSPKTSGNAGVSVEIFGRNFTPTNNTIRARGIAIKTGLISTDGTRLFFELPAGIPCSLNEMCPMSVTNQNGVSKTVAFKLSIPL